jgi:hypothetical protein
MSEAVHTESSARDFDFLMGSWNVHNRVLRKQPGGSVEWQEWEATSVARPLLDGLGNEDEFRGDYGDGFVAMSFRFFDPETRLWSIYWIDSRHCGVLGPPVFGAFSDDGGHFEGTDTFEGKPYLVRFFWSGVTTPTPKWEQSFSHDGGETWELNWVMEFTRMGDGS